MNATAQTISQFLRQTALNVNEPKRNYDRGVGAFANKQKCLRDNMNFFGTENRNEHTIAGRLIPLWEAVHRSITKAAKQPVSEAKYSVQLPVWCHNICDQLTKSVFRSLVDSAPKDGKFTARNWGRMTGFILRWASFCFNDAPAVLKREGFFDLSPEQEEKIEENSGIDLLFPIASEKFQKPITNEEELLEAGEAHFQKKSDEWMNQAFGVLSFFANQPISEQHKFLCGIPEGFTIVVNNEGEFTGKRGRYEIYLLLAMYWPEIVEMQKSEPPKTRRDLLEWLEKQEGKPLVEDEKQFYAICGDIGLDLAPPGHPKTSNFR
jgi:hypothetical protein